MRASPEWIRVLYGPCNGRFLHLVLFLNFMAYDKELKWLLEEKYEGKETLEYRRDAKRVLAGEPVDYVIGWRDFLGCRIFLNYRPLIPRVETEHWVELLLSGMRTIPPPKRILDLFSGSGAIGIALAKAFPKAEVIFSDLNTSAIEQTRENIEQNGVRAVVIRSDVFERIEGMFDLITANPPYIPHGSPDLSEATRAHEPHDALYADENGLAFIRELLENGKRYLTPKGVLAIEFDDPQKAALERIASENGWIAEWNRDQFGLWRSVFCTPK
jgi:release factor glutamine methyltransferase